MSDHAENLRVMNSVLLAVGNDWSDVLLDAAIEIDRLKAKNVKLREALRAVLASDFAEDCQECGIGQYPAWEAAKAALEDTKEP
jgi:hypothetical protein